MEDKFLNARGTFIRVRYWPVVFTGMYLAWNIFVLALLIVAPEHTVVGLADDGFNRVMYAPLLWLRDILG